MKTYYWDKFYKTNIATSKPSNFAKYCFNKYLIKNKNSKLLEIGCGNGRDSFFFLKKGISILAIDKSFVAIKNDMSIKKKERLVNIKFKKINLGSKKFTKLGKFNYIYCRFLLHAISKNLENKLLSSISKLCIKKKTIIMLEFRTTKDPLIKKGKKIGYNETFTNHYRRFVDVKILLKKIIKTRKFKILEAIEKKGFAKFKNENPVVCRLLLKRNHYGN